jgi:cell wall-associated NlpC family hydrolase
MQANAADYAYEQEIQRIEDRKNAESEAIQDTIDKKQEEMDLSQRAHDDAMKAIEDEKKAYSDAMDERITAQKTKNESMSTLIDDIKNEEIQSMEKVTEAFGVEAAKRYKEEVTLQMQATYALLQKQIIGGETTRSAAESSLLDMYNALFPRTGYNGSSLGPISSTVSEVLAFLNKPQFDQSPRIPGGARGQFADGGYISGPGGPRDDLIPAYLSNGEYVIRASSVERYGPEFFDALNAGRFADGGRVGDPVGDSAPTSQDRSPFARFVQRKPLEKERETRSGRGGRGSSGQGGVSPLSGDAASKAVQYVRSKLGDPYVLTPPGARPPNSWDCSKLTGWAWAVATGADPNLGYGDARAKVRLTPYSHSQGPQLTKRVTGIRNGKISGLVPGDILYFAPNGVGVAPGHTSMYVGGGKIIEASNPSTGVRETYLNNSWNLGAGKFQWAGPPKGYAKGGMIGSIPRKGIMPRYNLGGQVSMPSSNFSANSSMYNININANGVKDPAVVADIVIKRINSEKTRRQHSRVVS